MRSPASHTAGQRCGQPRSGSCGMPAPGRETAEKCHSHQPVVPSTARDDLAAMRQLGLVLLQRTLALFRDTPVKVRDSAPS